MTSHLEKTSFEDERIKSFFTDYGRTVLYVILALLTVFVIAYRLSSSSESKAEVDYLNADNAYQHFKQSLYNQNEPEFNVAFNQLKEMLKRHPELHAKYDGLIAQNLILRGDIATANEFANLVFKRTEQNDLPFYLDYAQTTLTLAHQDYTNALNEAQRLKEGMATKAKESKHPNPATLGYGDELFAFNLLRLAFIFQQLGNAQQELQAWNELLHFAGLNEKTSNNSALASNPTFFLITHLKEGKIVLLNYIEARIKMLHSHSS